MQSIYGFDVFIDVTFCVHNTSFTHINAEYHIHKFLHIFEDFEYDLTHRFLVIPFMHLFMNTNQILCFSHRILHSHKVEPPAFSSITDMDQSTGN